MAQQYDKLLVGSWHCDGTHGAAAVTVQPLLLTLQAVDCCNVGILIVSLVPCFWSSAGLTAAEWRCWCKTADGLPAAPAYAMQAPSRAAKLNTSKLGQ
jgi:hypothetical protein